MASMVLAKLDIETVRGKVVGYRCSSSIPQDRVQDLAANVRWEISLKQNIENQESGGMLASNSVGC